MEPLIISSDSDSDDVKAVAKGAKPAPKNTRKRKAPPSDNEGDSSNSDYLPPVDVKKRQKKAAPEKSCSSAHLKSRAKNSNPTKKAKNELKILAEPLENVDTLKNNESKIAVEWDTAEYLAELQQVDVHIASNIIHLFKEDNTIPFIARYRKEMTGDVGPEKLRDIKDTLETLEIVKHKAEVITKSIQKVGKLVPSIESSIRSARSLDELEHIYAPFKPGSKGTKAERARQLGLEQGAMSLLEGIEKVDVAHFIQPQNKGLINEKEVSAGFQHIIADVISKDRKVLDKLGQLKEDAFITMQVSKNKAVTRQKNKAESSKDGNKSIDSDLVQKNLERKFENYFEFSSNIRSIKPHQVLAITRGENLKVLAVKFEVPEKLMESLCRFCRQQWLWKGIQYQQRTEIIELAVKDAYSRLILPLLIRQVRTTLNNSAEKAAIEVFAENLKNLLLSPPLHGKTILGIDPGFRHGCKIGVVSLTGQVLHTDVIYPHFGNIMKAQHDRNAVKIKELIFNFNCEVVALGNGTACRETETWLSNLIQSNWFSPLDVTYTIVSEQGASIYSCSPLAKKEFDTMDPNLISAVSLARRVLDPMGELVKVEPQHLGVGMYQHDVPKKKLSTTLDEVVVECVSFVGVDVNTASESILQRIAGLSAARAAKILEWRITNGPFINREQLKKVKGIGAKIFEQCAGFIRVRPGMITDQRVQADEEKKLPATKKGTKKKKVECDSVNPLDRTWIHPESYLIAGKLISKCGLQAEQLGNINFISGVCLTVNKIGLPALSKEFGVDEPTMKLIADGLQQKVDHDIRAQSKKPLFRRGLTSMEDLAPGAILTGRAQNVTHFGVFVDIGVGTNGLIPIGKLRNIVRPVQLGDHLEVQVLSIEIQRKRISLNLIRVL